MSNVRRHDKVAPVRGPRQIEPSRRTHSSLVTPTPPHHPYVVVRHVCDSLIDRRPSLGTSRHRRGSTSAAPPCRATVKTSQPSAEVAVNARRRPSRWLFGWSAPGSEPRDRGGLPSGIPAVTNDEAAMPGAIRSHRPNTGQPGVISGVEVDTRAHPVTTATRPPVGDQVPASLRQPCFMTRRGWDPSGWIDRISSSQ